MASRDVSVVGLELIELSHALDSVRLLADAERAHLLASPRDARAAVRALAATVNVVAVRLRELGTGLAVEAQGARPRGNGRSRSPR